MDDSSDRLQLLYKLIKPSLRPASLAKGQSHSQNDSTKCRHVHRHTYMQKPAALWPCSSQSNPDGHCECEGGKESRRTAAKWNRMTHPWSLVRLLVMIFLILLICSVSYQAAKDGECLFQSQYVPPFFFFFFHKEKNIEATCISIEDLRICRSSIEMLGQLYYPLTRGKVSCF